MTRPITCSDCSEPALTVDEHLSAEDLAGQHGTCAHCGETGRILTYDDDGAVGVYFHCEALYEPSDLFGELRRQVEEERKAPAVTWETRNWSTTSALIAKEAAGWNKRTRAA